MVVLWILVICVGLEKTLVWNKAGKNPMVFRITQRQCKAAALVIYFPRFLTWGDERQPERTSHYLPLLLSVLCPSLSQALPFLLTSCYCQSWFSSHMAKIHLLATFTCKKKQAACLALHSIKKNNMGLDFTANHKCTWSSKKLKDKAYRTSCPQKFQSCG